MHFRNSICLNKYVCIGRAYGNFTFLKFLCIVFSHQVALYDIERITFFIHPAT